MKQKIRLGDCYALTKHKRTTIRYFSLLAVLTTMCLYAVKQVSAQEAEPAATAVTDIKPLQIGDTIPEHLWHLPLQVVNHPEGRDTITLNDYRGKLIILDFWGRYCPACIRALPVLDSLNKHFDGAVAPIAISDYKERTDREKGLLKSLSLSIDIPIVLENRLLKELFPHKILSHVAWITAEGTVSAITGSDHIKGGRISEALTASSLDWQVKRDDLTFDERRTLMHGQASRPLSYFALFPRMAGAPTRAYVTEDESGFLVRLINMDALSICHYLYKSSMPLVGYNRVVLELPDSLASRFQGNTVQHHEERFTEPEVYCLEVLLAGERRGDRSWEIIQRQFNDHLSSLYGVQLRIEKRLMDCMVLVRRDTNIDLTSGGEKPELHNDGSVFRMKNLAMASLIAPLSHGFRASGLPLVDETGYAGTIDLEINADISQPTPQLHDELARNGLAIESKPSEVEVLVITSIR